MQAFDTTYHPLGQLMENLVDVFRAAYVGVGAHPRLLQPAVNEVRSYIRRIYRVVRLVTDVSVHFSESVVSLNLPDNIITRVLRLFCVTLNHVCYSV